MKGLTLFLLNEAILFKKIVQYLVSNYELITETFHDAVQKNEGNPADKPYNWGWKQVILAKRKSLQTMIDQRFQVFENNGPDWSRTSDPHLVEFVTLI